MHRLTHSTHPLPIDSICFRFPIGYVVVYPTIDCMVASLKKRNETGTRDWWSPYPILSKTEDHSYGFVGLAQVDFEGAGNLALALSVILVVELDMVGCHGVELISDRRDVCFKGF